MESVHRAPSVTEQLGNRWPHRGDHSIVRKVCLQNIWCAQYRVDWCSKTCTVLQHWETRSIVPDEWCSPLPFDACTLPNNGLEKCSLWCTWASGACRYGMETWRFRSTAHTDVTEPNPRKLPGNDFVCMPEAMQDASLQMSPVRATLHSNVCMSATDWWPNSLLYNTD